MKRIQPKASAFTLVEVIVMVCLVVVLFMVMPSTFGPGQRALRVACVKNLKNMGLAHRIFANDHNDKFPAQFAGANTNNLIALLRCLTNEISPPEIFYCPSDKSRSPAKTWGTFSTNNVSYFLNLSASETYPQSFLAGDSDLMVNGVRIASGQTRVPVTATVSWSTNRHRGSSFLLMGDGSVQELGTARLQQALAESGTNDMILLAP